MQAFVTFSATWCAVVHAPVLYVYTVVHAPVRTSVTVVRARVHLLQMSMLLYSASVTDVHVPVQYVCYSCPCSCTVHLLQMSMLLYSLMPTLGGHGSAGVKHAENWSASMKRLVNSVHETLNELFEQVPTGA